MNLNFISKSILTFIFLISFSTNAIPLDKVESLKNGFYSGLVGIPTSILPIFINSFLVKKKLNHEPLLTMLYQTMWVTNLYIAKKWLNNKCNDFVLVGSSLIAMYFMIVRTRQRIEKNEAK